MISGLTLLGADQSPLRALAFSQLGLDEPRYFWCLGRLHYAAHKKTAEYGEQWPMMHFQRKTRPIVRSVFSDKVGTRSCIYSPLVTGLAAVQNDARMTPACRVGAKGVG